jgi:ubiquitin-small subunit ribosomal protein S27Ae
MAAPAKKEAAKGGKVKKRKTSQKWKAYTLSGKKLERKNKFCPKCGTGVFMAKHKNRLTCGQCHYMEKA